MNRNLFILPVLLVLLLAAGCATTRSFHTANFALNGNCQQCESLIEDAAFKKNEAEANWDPATKQVYLIFDSKKTTADEVYKRLAYAGFDAPGFRAPDDIYASLPACCKYKRTIENGAAPLTQTPHDAHAGHNMHTPETKAPKTDAKAAEHAGHAGHQTTQKQPETTPANPPKRSDAHAGHEQTPAKTTAPKPQPNAHAGHTTGAAKTPAKAYKKAPAKPASAVKPAAQQTNLLADVYTHYFAVKDALVKDNSKTAAAKAIALEKAITAVPMNKLSSDQHDVWMTHYKNLQTQAGQIARAKNITAQRTAFASLSASLEPVMKAISPDTPVYLQHCPMFNNNKGANWLSKEKTIRNPYYGPAMLSCGSTKQTIK